MSQPTAERGSATIEVALLAPVFTMLLALVVLVGRVESSRADIEGVADGAARAISLSRSPRAAVASAKSEAESSLRVGSSTCRAMGWVAEVSPGSVTVTVACTIDLSAASILPVPSHYTVRATATEVIDRFRENTS
jgi:Flp pilus assembly protein TadG